MRILCLPGLLSQAVCAVALAAQSPEPSLPAYLRDRGPGIATSMFGTYIRKGELLVYPFLELYRDRDYEYKPSELGYGLDEDYRGRYTATEGLIFLAYGFTERLAVELEAAVISARLEKDPSDPTLVPAAIKESGIGDVEGQIRMRWANETRSRPEFYSFFEAVSPRNRDKPLIGTEAWEFKLASGLIKGTSLGTFTLRAALEYSKAEAKLEPGEYALEYLKRLSSRLLLYTGVEGVQDEVEWISELQVRLSRYATIKLNNAFGLTSKATDWAPEVGIMFSLSK
jgi:hypothetical protein